MAWMWLRDETYDRSDDQTTVVEGENRHDIPRTTSSDAGSALADGFDSRE